MWTSIRRLIPIILVMLTVIGISSLTSIHTQAQTSDGCPTYNFIDPAVSTLQDGYPDAQLIVTCDDQYINIAANGMITYEFIAITPSNLAEQDYNWRIPRTPQMTATPSDIPIVGPVAVAINGIPFFGPNEAPRDNYGDPYLDNILDFCNGHTAQGMYHYHARPDCLYDSTGNNIGAVIGYAFDGFPILSPWVCADDACTSVTKLQSSWQRTHDVPNAWEAHEYISGSGDLDQCNGRILSDGSYAYYATDTFPYILGCYAGVAELNANNALPGGGGQPGDNGQPTQGQDGQLPQGGNGQLPPDGNGQPPQGRDGQLPPPRENDGQRPPRPGQRPPRGSV